MNAYLPTKSVCKYTCFIHNHPKVESTQRPFTDEWVNKLWYMYSMELHLAIKSNKPLIPHNNNMDKFEMHFAKWKKSGWKGYMSEWVSESHLVVSDSLWPHRLYSPWNSLGQNTGLPLFILPWRIIPFSRRSSQPRDQTQVSRIAGRFFTSWATRGAWKGYILTYNFIFIMLWNYRDGKQVSGCQALKNEWGIWLQKGNTGNPGANWKRMET